MCGVVGPNGCGKSNIIDAVRWVMGESSAKNLRGDAMIDVIFKGSSTRKPSAFAQVELIFDNSQGRVVGEYAAYSEISIKRRLSSDSQNLYFLNGTKCRRRDIMDIFLGTGLGPRSYSIISQGIVSNLIESKPEELRVFIEEAAGISKYKERRRETENRMRRTSENLERLTDLREELGRQLSHLEQQAEAAKKYKKYQQEIRLSRAQLSALRWKETDGQIQCQENAIRDFEVQLEAAIAGQRSYDAKLESFRDSQTELNEQFHASQAVYYGTGNEITRIEQDMTHRQERQKQLEKDLQEIKILLQEIEEQYQSDKDKLENYKEAMMSAEPELELAREQDAEMSELLLETEDRYRQWQQHWDTFSQKAGDARHQAQLEQSRIQHFEQSLARISEKLQRQYQEQNALHEDSDQIELEMLKEKQEVISEQVLQTESVLDQQLIEIHELRETTEQFSQNRIQKSASLSEHKGKLASLAALQQSSAKHSEHATSWLIEHQMISKPRLASLLAVKPGWERAVETVLGATLQAVCINRLEDVTEQLRELTDTGLSFFCSKKQEDETDILQPQYSKLKEQPLLQEMVAGEVNVKQYFTGIYAVETVKEALSFHNSLEVYESIITSEGIWLGKNWLKLACDSDVKQGVLQRQKQIDLLECDIKVLENTLDELEVNLLEVKMTMEQKEVYRETVQLQLNEQRQAHGQLNANITAHQVRTEQLCKQRMHIEEEVKELQTLQSSEQSQMEQARDRLQEAVNRMGEDTTQREKLQANKDILKHELEEGRLKSREKREDAHRREINYQSLKAQINSLQQALERLDAQKRRSQTKQEQLEKQGRIQVEPEDDPASKLEILLNRRSREESAMQLARNQLEEVECQIKDLESNRQSTERKAMKIRNCLEQQRMEWQAMKVKRATLLEQLSEESFDLKAVLANVSEKTTTGDLSSFIEKLEGRIKRLGAINLAAIEEFEQQAKRKHYLDEQNGDLESALGTLESAIKKIDKESRVRFKHTFELVDQGLRALFPKIFGGGQAYLELTEEDLLETGVSIMAQPPGKKNSSIHMLSGGEKALTAIALVFAIFRLNPSPFCMLDEVDAPLDDANVSRYANMVSEMSEQVQFIYISHNKIAMEAASQLIGITMQEPGVSRPVSVDIEKAVAMAVV